MDGAILSRSLTVDLTMTADEKIERMRHILENILPDYDLTTKQLSLNFLENLKDEVDINLRTLIMVAKICKSFPDTWENLATYMVKS